jgi:hypothetical protein
VVIILLAGLERVPKIDFIRKIRDDIKKIPGS